MIFGNIEHCRDYYGICDNLDKALAWMETAYFEALPDGARMLCGEAVRASLRTITTKPESQAALEAHVDFLDIQLVLRGREKYQLAFRREVIQTQASPEKDLDRFEGRSRALVLEAGQFLILFPDDVHAPGLADATPSMVRKAIIKVKWR